jgi:hypothetical protein
MTEAMILDEGAQQNDEGHRCSSVPTSGGTQTNLPVHELVDAVVGCVEEVLLGGGTSRNRRHGCLGRMVALRKIG